MRYDPTYVRQGSGRRINLRVLVGSLAQAAFTGCDLYVIALPYYH